MNLPLVDRRRRNLRSWIDLHHKTQAEFVSKYNLNQGEISSLLKDKSFGERKARNIETQVGMPTGYLDEESPAIETTTQVIVWDRPEDLSDSDDRVWIDRWDFRFSAGDGHIQWEHQQKLALPFTRSFFDELSVNPKNAKLVKVIGDSMEPRLYDGDLMMIDSSQTEVRDGLIYAVFFEGEALVKQIFKEPGGVLVLRSFNENYRDKIINPSDDVEFKVAGRVVYKSGKSGF